ncbi:DUF418 domain-containing protein [Hyalangium rubrum]|uniref:DUF418 domain-containing protein n=1 Tax=Hyalangium rubrum TaxID=3103134 RepID=A0ABU5GYI2_9BACT|nr:DUF418 domain-containing protein [Hyalangium sp. s54d21]MDY7226250.1 DUF418 domain-containing protein [Hyalangium sp. s54d21]
MDGGERLVLIDTLRGFALCGIFVSNVFMWFSGRFYLSRAQQTALADNESLLDTVARHAAQFFVYGKFITLFAFLFGLGFAVQMGRAEKRGASIVPLYARRLGVLLCLGLAHLFLLWHGDILTTYALVGFTLLLFRGRSDKALLSCAAVLIFLVPIAILAIQRFPQLLGSAEATAAATQEATERATALRTQTWEAFTSGSYFEVLSASATYYLHEILKPMLFGTCAVLGRFLLGLLAGRSGLFHHASQHQRLFRKVLLWGFVAGVLGTSAGLVVRQLTAQKVLDPASMPWLPLITTPLRHLGDLGLGAFYVASLTLLFQRPHWQRWLSVLAPAGRMTLTNYLCQTVSSVLLFYGYGLGLFGKAGPALCVALAVGIFTVQLALSHLWLARFRFGPAEWLWRSLTYGKAQPMRRAPATVPTVAV